MIKFNRSIDFEQAKKIYRSTSGFPLGVAVLLDEIEKGTLLENDLGDFAAGSSPSRITAELARRFLKHVASDRDERRRLISFITLRMNEGGQSLDRFNLLKLLWERLGLARDPAHFDGELQALKRKYSFLLSNGLLHSEVWRYLRHWALSSEFEPALTLDVCQAAYRICDVEQEGRAKKLRDWHGEDQYESKKYRDVTWQNWILDTIHYELWRDNVDDAVELVLNHYVMALIYGLSRFATQVVDLCGESNALNGRLDAHHRQLIHQLKSLSVGSADEEINSTRNQLHLLLRGKARFAMHLTRAKTLARKGEHAKSEMEATEAEKMAKLDDASNATLRRELGRVLLLLGDRLSASTNSKSVQFRAKDILERAQKWTEGDPHVLCSLGDVCLKVDWLDDARSFFTGASSEVPRRAQAGLDRVRAREAIVGAQPSAANKVARLYTTHASTLCAEARFDEAMRKVRYAIDLAPAYLPAKIKRCHILRVQGDIAQSYRELMSIDSEQIGQVQWKASLFDALGATLLALEEGSRAEKVYKDALELSPDYMNALYGLGRVYLQSEQYAEAIDQFNKVISVRRRITGKKSVEVASLYWVYVALGIAHAAVGESMDADHAFMIAEKLCDRDLLRNGSRHYQLWAHKTLALLGQKQYAKADETMTILTSIPSAFRAKGVYHQVVVDANLLSKVDRSEEFRRVAGAFGLLQ